MTAANKGRRMNANWYKKEAPLRCLTIGTASSDNKEFFLMLRPKYWWPPVPEMWPLVPIVRRFDPDKAQDYFALQWHCLYQWRRCGFGNEILRKKKFSNFVPETYDRGKNFFLRNFRRSHNAVAAIGCTGAIRMMTAQSTLLDCLGFAPLLCDVHDEEDGLDGNEKVARVLPARHNRLRHPGRRRTARVLRRQNHIHRLCAQ